MERDERDRLDVAERALKAFLDQPLGAYLDAVASGAPTPGGGSVGGVSAALGAALGEMVCNLTKPKAETPGLAIELAAEIEDARARLANLRALAGVLALEDEGAYRQYRAASALARETSAEREQRVIAIQAALTIATDVPLRLAGSSLAVLETLETVARLGNRHALSDAMLAAHLARTAIDGALLNVRGNAAMLKDPAAAAAAQAVADRLEPAAIAAEARVAATIAARG